MAQAIFNDYCAFKEQNAQDVSTINLIVEKNRQEFQQYVSLPEKKDYEEIDKLVRHTALTMKKFSNSHYKNVSGLGTKDLEQIKDALRNFICKSEASMNIRSELIKDLTAFQKNVSDNHYKKIVDLTKQKHFLEKQIKVYDFEKHKLISQRLSKIMWPYDEKTKEYENKISELTVKVDSLARKIYILNKTQPAASEKDILFYEMQLKEKYLRKE